MFLPLHDCAKIPLKLKCEIDRLSLSALPAPSLQGGVLRLSPQIQPPRGGCRKCPPPACPWHSPLPGSHRGAASFKKARPSPRPDRTPRWAATGMGWRWGLTLMNKEVDYTLRGRGEQTRDGKRMRPIDHISEKRKKVRKKRGLHKLPQSNTLPGSPPVASLASSFSCFGCLVRARFAGGGSSSAPGDSGVHPEKPEPIYQSIAGGQGPTCSETVTLKTPPS